MRWSERKQESFLYDFPYITSMLCMGNHIKTIFIRFTSQDMVKSKINCFDKGWWNPITWPDKPTRTKPHLLLPLPPCEGVKNSWNDFLHLSPEVVLKILLFCSIFQILAKQFAFDKFCRECYCFMYGSSTQSLRFEKKWRFVFKSVSWLPAIIYE